MNQRPVGVPLFLIAAVAILSFGAGYFAQTSHVASAQVQAPATPPVYDHNPIGNNLTGDVSEPASLCPYGCSLSIEYRSAQPDFVTSQPSCGSRPAKQCYFFKGDAMQLWTVSRDDKEVITHHPTEALSVEGTVTLVPYLRASHHP